MVNRRQIATLGLLSMSSGLGFAAPASPVNMMDDDLPPLPKTRDLDLSKAINEEDFASLQLDQRVLGRHDPGKEAKKIARAIMDKAPKNCRPVEVASYYRDLGQGKTAFGEEGRPYARAWPRVYNPVIIEFFTATGLNPLSPSQRGDETAWCAAFLNYCIARAVSKNGQIGAKELGMGTRSASSGSFRCFGDAVPQGQLPREGDIAVWALEGSIDGCRPGTGHVGFVTEGTGIEDKPYFILGGNQGGDLLSTQPQRTLRSGVFRKAMPVKYVGATNPVRYKTILGYRTASFL